MALHIFSAIVSSTIPSSYYFPAVVTLLLLVITRAYTQGRRTNRDRDLHGRTVIVTVSQPVCYCVTNTDTRLRVPSHR